MVATGGGRNSSGEGDALDRFPAGLRVLVVDDDRISLKLLEHMLRKCLYEVTVCSESMKALSLLRGSKDSFDIVISDVHMPDMDGFKLLELVGLEMDLPVIMMSGDERTSAVMRGIKHGACDYLIKPVRMQELKTIWQHAVRKSLNIDSKEHGYSGSRELEVSDCRNASSNDDECGRLLKQKKKKKKKKRQFAATKGKDGSDEDGELDNDEPSTSKKPRIVWTFDLHQKFCIAVNQLGIDNAVPKRVLELMNVPGLTRENVASHLQKYRISLKRMVHHGGPIEVTPTSMLLGRQVVSCTSSTNIVLPPLEHPNFIQNSTQHSHHAGGDGFNQTQLVECNSNMSNPFFANTNIIALDNVVSSGYSDCWSPNNNFGMTQQQQLQTPSLMIPSTATYQLPIHQNSFGDAGSMTTDYNTLFSSHENFRTPGLLSNVYGSMPGPIIDNNNGTNSNSSNHFSSSGF